MILRSNDFDLGRDHTRIKDPKDAERQQRTVDVLLERFFNPEPECRFDIQILADEVGMGKTFVALGLAYSILAHLRQGPTEPDLAGCYKRILVLTPNNSALYRKWVREVDEFKRRCVARELESSDLAFAPEKVERLDDLPVVLRRSGRQPQVIVARMGLFSREKLLDYDLKRRFILGVLFRFWGVSFNRDQRERLLRGAPVHWPKLPDNLTVLTEDEDMRLPFSENQFLDLLRTFRNDDLELLNKLLDRCRQIAQPFFRDREEAFASVEQGLVDVYRLSAFRSIQKDFPLLIVDEAHNWKNGPLAGANGFRAFSDYIAPHVRRALLLTATPFQLRPEEILEILKVSDFMRPCPNRNESNTRVEQVRKFREETVRPSLTNSETQSRIFNASWAKVPQRVKPGAIEEAWVSSAYVRARERLQHLSRSGRTAGQRHFERDLIIAETVAGTDPDIRHFLREGLRLYSCNADLSSALGKIVIRHRRLADHRLFRIGSEYELSSGSLVPRPDSHLLHASPGLDIRGEAELPHYLLMRCVSEMKGGRGRSSLAGDLTGCYSTLHASAEGRKIQKALKESPAGKLYLDLLFALVDKRHDPKHPKMEAVVKQALACWKAGEKVLIFCVRINTAERLRDIISDRVRKELEAGKKKCLGGEGRLKSLRSRLTGRDRDLVGLGLDRVLWSYAWSREGLSTLVPAEFVLDDQELAELARLSLLFNTDVAGERIDRVFLNRVTEHILAIRFSKKPPEDSEFARLLKQMSQLSWIAHPYGLHYEGEHEDENEESSSFDERGCHTIYTASSIEPAVSEVASLAESLMSTRLRARHQKQIPLLDSYALAPSLWLGAEPQLDWQNSGTTKSEKTLRMMHEYLWQLSIQEDDNKTTATAAPFDWRTRIHVLQALRRALLRESVLLRLLPERSDLEESGWGVVLTRAFFADLPGQHECMAHRIAVFLEDLKASSGDITEPISARGALYQATRLRDQQFVALVTGAGNAKDTRDRIFNGFNTPLLPEILICTSVGQEGIDLHRHCRYVIHYDLAWNPAVLEQRTGRTDRIGSKTFRERDAAALGQRVVLDIGVPFLAGTYDERMYEELRLRAQTFEVLTGGDFAADHAGEIDDSADPRIQMPVAAARYLPEKMVEDLRVGLQVWDVRSPSSPSKVEIHDQSPSGTDQPKLQ